MSKWRQHRIGWSWVGLLLIGTLAAMVFWLGANRAKPSDMAPPQQQETSSSASGS